MIEGIVLGVIQGVAEWIPVSSEGMIALVEINFFGKSGIEEIIHLALFLHMGTFLAALIYLRKDVIRVLKSLFRYKASFQEEKRLLRFLVVSTAISSILGFLILRSVSGLESEVEFSGRIFTATIGVFLLVTAWLQLKKQVSNAEIRKKEGDMSTKDSVILGLAQGMAVLPGISRSGLTVSALLLRRVEDEAALRLSFLMSLPIVFFGNIFLNFGTFVNPGSISSIQLWGLAFSFIFGLAAIHFLIKLARKINFGYFVGIFGFLMILSVLV
jgi:undecaprenyl-diphosphatase